LHWKPLNVDQEEFSKDSFWGSQAVQEDDTDMLLDEDEFNMLFVKTATPPKVKTKKNVATPKQSVVTLIDPKTATNVGIAIARIKIPYSDIRKAIESMDDKVLTLTQLQVLQDLLPSKEDAEKLASFKGDRDKLGVAEKFFIEIIKIKRCKAKIDALVYQMQFPDTLQDMRVVIRKAEKASDDVRISDKLVKILKFVLKIGNQLNGGDGNQIRGFSLDSLSKLSQTKAFNQKTTMLHYLVKVVKKNAPDIMDFPSQISTVETAARSGYDNIGADVAKVRKDLTALQKEAEMQKKEGTEESALALFTMEAEKRLVNFEAEVDKVAKKYAGLLKYFHEDLATKSEAFFENLSQFCRAFQRACIDVENEIRTQQRLKRQEEEKKRLADMKHNKQRRASLNPDSLKFVKMPPPGPPPNFPPGSGEKMPEIGEGVGFSSPVASKRKGRAFQRRNTVMGLPKGSPSSSHKARVTTDDGEQGIKNDDDLIMQSESVPLIAMHRHAESQSLINHVPELELEISVPSQHDTDLPKRRHAHRASMPVHLELPIPSLTDNKSGDTDPSLTPPSESSSEHSVKPKKVNPPPAPGPPQEVVVKEEVKEEIKEAVPTAIVEEIKNTTLAAAHSATTSSEEGSGNACHLQARHQRKLSGSKGGFGDRLRAQQLKEKGGSGGLSSISNALSPPPLVDGATGTNAPSSVAPFSEPPSSSAHANEGGIECIAETGTESLQNTSETGSNLVVRSYRRESSKGRLISSELPSETQAQLAATTQNVDVDGSSTH